MTILFLFYALVFWLQDMWDLSCLNRDWTCTPCFGRRSLSHCTSREVPEQPSDKQNSKKKTMQMTWTWFLHPPLHPSTDPLSPSPALCPAGWPVVGNVTNVKRMGGAGRVRGWLDRGICPPDPAPRPAADQQRLNSSTGGPEPQDQQWECLPRVARPGYSTIATSSTPLIMPFISCWDPGQNQ